MDVALKVVSLSLGWALLSCLASPGFAQEIELRRWSHLPIDTNFAAVGYAHTNGERYFDPALRIEDVNLELQTWVARYVRTFEVLGKSARLDIVQAWQEGRWTGLLNGVATSVERQGLSDTVARFAVNLVGAPPLAGTEYAAYRAAIDVETLFGAAIAVQLPTGQYKEDKLINLGSNRFSFRPQLGIVHNRGSWSFEATGAAWIFTDNNEFFNGNQLKQDPLFTFDIGITHTFRPGFWATISAAYAAGGQSTINGIEKNDHKENVAWGISTGYQVGRALTLNASYVASRRQTSIGLDSDTFSIGLSANW